MPWCKKHTIDYLDDEGCLYCEIERLRVQLQYNEDLLNCSYNENKDLRTKFERVRECLNSNKFRWDREGSIYRIEALNKIIDGE